MFEAMIKNLISHRQSSHDDIILNQIMSFYRLNWRLVIVAILLTHEEFIRTINHLMKVFDIKDLGEKNYVDLQIKFFSIFKRNVSPSVSVHRESSKELLYGQIIPTWPFYDCLFTWSEQDMFHLKEENEEVFGP